MEFGLRQISDSKMQPTTLRLGMRPDRHDGLRNIGGHLSVPCPQGDNRHMLPTSGNRVGKCPTTDERSVNTHAGGRYNDFNNSPSNKHLQNVLNVNEEDLVNKVLENCRSRTTDNFGRVTNLGPQKVHLTNENIDNADLLRRGLHDKLLHHARGEMPPNKTNDGYSTMIFRRNFGEAKKESNAYENDSNPTIDVKSKTKNAESNLHNRSSEEPPLVSPISSNKYGTVIEETEYFSERKYSIDSISSDLSESQDSLPLGFEPQITSTTTVTTSKVRFSMPSMEFVWENDPSGKSIFNRNDRAGR